MIIRITLESDWTNQAFSAENRNGYSAERPFLGPIARPANRSSNKTLGSNAHP